MTAAERAALRHLHRSSAAGVWRRGPEGQILAENELGRPMRLIAVMAGWATRNDDMPWPTADLLVAARNALAELLDDADARQEALDAALSTAAELQAELSEMMAEAEHLEP